MGFFRRVLGLLGLFLGYSVIIPQAAYSDVVVDETNVKDFVNFLTTIENTIEIPESSIQPYEESTHTPCGLMTATAYCPENQTIYVNISEMANYAASYGDNAFYVILSHEWGHHFLTAISYVGPAIGEELAADCISGYLFGMYNQLNDWKISEDELVRIITMTSIVGDYSGFTTSHGIAEQRVAYIYRGIKGAENVDGLKVCLR